MRGRLESSQDRFFYNFRLDDVVPADHLVRRVFETVVGTRLSEGLVGGEGFSVDAGFIVADASRTKRAPGDEPIDRPDRERASRAVAEYPGVLDRDRDAENKGDRKKKPAKAISLTDPLAAWVAKQRTSKIMMSGCHGKADAIG